jgi:hypothetical protein
MRRIAIASVGVGVLTVGLLGVVAGPAAADHEGAPLFGGESLRSIPTVGDAICDTIEKELISKNPGGPQDELVDLWHHGFCPVGGATTPPPPEDDGEGDPDLTAVLCQALLDFGGEAQDGGVPDEFNLFLIAAGELCEGDPCAADDPPEECIEDPCAVDDPPAECDDPPDTSTTTTTDGGGGGDDDDDDAEVLGATQTGGGNTVQAASAEGDGSLPRTGGDLLAGASAGVSFLALSGLVRRFARR